MSADPTVLKFVVPGEPVPKGRARFRIVTSRGGKPFGQEYTPAETRAYEERVKLLAQVAVNQAGWSWDDEDRFAVLIRVFRTHWEKGGDIDNYGKAALDGMNGTVFPDDRYVRGFACSLMDPDPTSPRVEVEVRRVSSRRRKGAGAAGRRSRAQV